MEKKIIIVGAGGHGQVVAEIAGDCGYSDIVFFDDNNENAVGTIYELEKLKENHVDVFVSIGNNKLRGQLLNRIKEIGFNVPVLIHPTAYVSRTCEIKEGSIVEPKAIVNSGTIIGEGSIVGVGAIIDHNVTVGKYCHINAGSIVKAGAEITDYEKLEAGEVILGYKTSMVR